MEGGMGGHGRDGNFDSGRKRYSRIGLGCQLHLSGVHLTV